MTWADRLLKKGAYTSPSGARFEFDYEDLSRSTSKRVAEFEFADVNGTYPQSNGHSGRKYPMRCIFWGDDCDLVATAFENAVLEDGEGRLEHPLYGTFQAVPMGDVERVDKVLTEANQSVVEVSFVDALGTVYPDAGQDARGTVTAIGASFKDAAALEFADQVDVSTVAGREGLADQVQRQLDALNAALGPALAEKAEAQRQFEDAIDTVSRSISTLTSAPAELAAAVLTAIEGPALAGAAVRDVLAGFVLMASDSRSQAGATPSDYVPEGGSLPDRSVTVAQNAFQAARLFSSGALAAYARAASTGTYTARPQAISAATALLSQLDDHVAWAEAGYATLSQVDTGAGYQALQRLVAVTAGYLVQTSFQLAAERRLTLTGPRTIIDLAAELYGQVDEQLDRMIDDNDLNGDEILMLPAGTVVVYYA